MTLHVGTQEMLRELERAASRKLRYPEAIGALLDAARASGRMEAFLETAFLAKFVTKSLRIMKRIGVDGEGYDKLSAESESNLAKASSLLRSFNEGLPDDLRQRHDELFFTMTQESIGRFVILLEDLTTLKNWALDGGRIPDGSKSTRNIE